MPRVKRVKKARKAQGSCGKCGVPIKVGDPYVWWKFKFGARHVRCAKEECYPKASDFTQSEFLSALYDLQDQACQCHDGEELQALADEVRDLGSEQEDKLRNMPESLQYSPTGELLQERVDSCEAWAGDLENHVYEFEQVQEMLDEADTEEAESEAEDARAEWINNIPEYPG